MTNPNRGGASLQNLRGKSLQTLGAISRERIDLANTASNALVRPPNSLSYSARSALMSALLILQTQGRPQLPDHAHAKSRERQISVALPRSSAVGQTLTPSQTHKNAFKFESDGGPSCVSPRPLTRSNLSTHPRLVYLEATPLT